MRYYENSYDGYFNKTGNKTYTTVIKFSGSFELSIFFEMIFSNITNGTV